MDCMTSLDRYVEQAIPHEAGHILVGRILGVPVFGLDHIVIRGPNHELFPGNFATKTLSPDPAIVPYTPLRVLAAYACMAGGGLAGNIVSKVLADEYGLEKDRADLKVVSTKALEEAAEQARKIIEQEMDVFEKLRVAIRCSYTRLLRPNISVGRHTLLTNDELEQICAQNKELFPPTSYR
jgi:hypothetical protein